MIVMMKMKMMMISEQILHTAEWESTSKKRPPPPTPMSAYSCRHRNAPRLVVGDDETQRRDESAARVRVAVRSRQVMRVQTTKRGASAHTARFTRRLAERAHAPRHLQRPESAPRQLQHHHHPSRPPSSLHIDDATPTQRRRCRPCRQRMQRADIDY